MKKTLTAILALSLVLSMTACGGSPASTPSAAPPASGSVSASVGESAAPEATPEPTPEPVPEAPKYPLTYTPRVTDPLGGNIVRNEMAVVFDKTTPIMVEYTELARQLESIYKETEIVWPELDDQWKGWNYMEITNKDGVSSRTLNAGGYTGKGDQVIKEHIDWLKGIAGNDFKVVYLKQEEVKDDESTVPYSMIETTKSLTDKELAGAAYECFYLQTWYLVPAADQGVCIKTGDGTYTAEDILKLHKG